MTTSSRDPRRGRSTPGSPDAASPSSGRARSGIARDPGSIGADAGSGYAPGSSPLARAPTAALRRSTPSGANGRPDIPRDAHGKPAFGPVKRFGDYTLIKKLATGGMAEIWLARQTGIAGFARFLVVKKILSHLAEQETFVRMFQDEARTSAMLAHPNIVQIHDLGQADSTYYIAMEYIAGENLAAIAWRGMKRGKPFPTAFAARVIADACKALHYAHNLVGNDGVALDIVHRDVSPQNILVTYEGEVKVVDFGIAKAATKTEHTKTGMLKGKFSYMSPEQCLGAPVDRRSDIFALGILLYELCTGKRLYKHESELMILEMITKRSIVPPSKVTPNIPEELEEIILRALEKDAQERFQTAQEMQLALDAHLRNVPEPVNDAELSAYMGTLFRDKIDEKRRLRERASRDDFERLFLDEEATERGMSLRRTVQGGSPNQVQVYGAAAQGTHGQGAYPSGTYPAGVDGMPAAYVEEQQPSWASRLVALAALMVIAIAGAVLYAHFTASNEVVTTTRFTPGPAAPAKPVLTGAITLESSPSQATIYLDGKPMALGDGANAQTPSDLKGLQYGKTYTITFKKEGYEAHVEEIQMGESMDGRSFHPTLEPFPGRIVTEVRGLGAGETQITYDGKPVGQGPRISAEMPGNTTVLVEATLPDEAAG